MNRIYRLVFNRALGQVQAVSEVASQRHGAGCGGAGAAAPAKAALCAALFAVAGHAAAQAPGAQDLPTGGTVVGGNVSISTGAGTMEIVQNGRAVIDWNTFDIGSDASVRFTQGAGSVALNRILDSDASQILGRLDADATIFLINPNGILFGAGAQVNVGGLLASTLEPARESYPGAPDPIADFLQGSLWLNLALGSNASGAIVNRGTLRGGQIALAGGYVENAAGATIEADGGRVDLVGAAGVELTLEGGPFSVRIQRAVQNTLEAALVNNQGLIRADGGSVTLSGRGAVGTVNTVVNTEGAIEASNIVLSGDGGQLRAGGDIAASGSLNLSSSDNQAYLDGDIEAGSLTVQARSIRQAGGTLDVAGTADLTASYWDVSGERFGDIVLDGDGNAFGGTVGIAGQNVTLDSTTGLRFGALRAGGNLTVGSQGAVAFAGGTVGGALDVEAAGTITQTAALTVRGTAALDAGNHAVVLDRADNDFVGTVDAAGAGISLADANTLAIGSLSNAPDRALSLLAGADLVLPAGAIDTGSAALTLSAGGALTTPGALRGGTVELHGGTALNLGHDVGGDASVALSSGGAIVQAATATIDTAHLTVDAASASLLGANAVDALGDVRTGGDFRLRNAQAIAQADGTTVGVGGAAEFDAGAADIVLDAAGNSFGGEVALRGGDLTLDAGGLLRLGELANGTDADVRLSAGQIDLSLLGGIDTGTGALELEAVDGTLATAGALRGGDVRLSAADGLLLGHDVAAGERLTLDSRGAIVQQAGALSAPVLDVAGAGVVVLDGANRVGALGDIEAGGAFTLVNAQAIVQAADGTLDIGGASRFDAGGARIALDAAGNRFGGSVGLQGGEVSIRGAGTLTLAAVEAASLEASASTIRLSADIATEGDQTYRGPVSLVADATLASGQGGIAFEGAVGGAYRLTANAGGDASFGGGVSVRSLAVDAATFGAAGALSTTEGLDIAARAGAIGQNGAWTVGGTASLSGATGIDLRHVDNDFRGPVNLGGGTAVAIHDRDTLTLGTLATGALTATSGGALDLGAGTVDGALVATSATGGIGQSGALTVTGASTLDAGTGAIALAQAGNDFVGSVAASGAGIVLRDANDLAIGRLTSAADHAVALTAGGTLSLPAAAIDTGSAALTLSSGGTLATAGSLAGSEVRLHGDSGLRLDHAVTGRTSLALSSGGSVYGLIGPIATPLLTVDAGTTVLSDQNNAIDAIGDIAVDGAFVLNNARAIRQAADSALNVTGQSTFDAGTHAIDLQNTGNVLAGEVNLFGGTTTIRQDGALALGFVSTGALTVSSGGALGLGRGTVRGALAATSAQGGIGQSGALTVTGGATLDAGGGAIALTQAENDFRGTVALTGGRVEIRDRDALTLGALDTGALTATSGGALTLGAGQVGGALVATSATGGIGQSGALTVTGDATLDAGTGAIVLAQAGNDFQGSVGLTGGPVEIRDRDGLTLGVLDTGALTATSGGALNLGSGRVGGALTATSAQGGIGQSGALTVTGGAVLDAGGDAIALAQAENDFQGAVDLAGGAVEIHDRDALTLGELDTGALTATSGDALDLGHGRIGGALIATSAQGGIGQSGALEVAGTGTFDAGTGAIALGQAGNRFAGALSLSAGDAVTVRDRGDLTVASLSAGANAGVHLEAGGRLALPAQALDTGDGALTLISGQLLETAGALSGGAVELRGGQGVALGHDVTARDTLVLSSASGAIAQSAGRVSATGHATVVAAQGVSLEQAGNDFDTIAVSGTDVRLRDADELELTGVEADRLHVQAQTIRLDLDAVDTSGDQTYAGRVALDRNVALTSRDGDLAFQAVDGGAYGLTARAAQGAVDFGGAVALRALDVAAATFRAGSTLATTEALAIATTGGGIGQNGAWTIGGTADLSASGGIELRDDGNDFVGPVSLEAGGDVAVYDANALTVAALASGADADVHLEAGGLLTLPAQAIDTGTGALTLVSGGRLDTAGALSGGAVTLRSAETLSLRHDVDAAGLELVSTGGDIVQSGGRVAVSGHTEARAAQGIDLSRGDNDFATLGVAGTDVRLRDVDALRLTGVQARSLDVQAQTIRLDVDVETVGGQTYDGRLALDRDTALTSASGDLRFQAVDGARGLTARALAGSIDFAGAVALGALDTASIGFHAGSTLSTAGTLGIRTTGGGIAQSAAWTVGGTTTLDAAGGIDLTDAGNDFGQAVYLSANGVAGATLVDRNDLTVAALSLRPNASLALRALGRLTLPDQAIDTGTGALTLLAGDTLSTTAALSGGAITLHGDRGIALGHDVTARSFLSLWSRDGAIAQTGGRVVASGLSSAVAAQGVSLDREGNDFDALSVSGTDVRLRDDNAVRLTGIGATDLHVQAQTIHLDLDAVSTSGDQTYAGRVALDRDVALSSGDGDLAFQAVDGGAYGLTARAAQGAVDFGGAVALRELDVQAATFRAGGTLATTEALAIATTGGGIGQNGAWTVGGTADLRASGGIALRDDGNDFVGPVSLEAGEGVALRDANDLTVASLSAGAGHGVHLEAGGALTLPGQAIDTGDGALTLVSGGTLSTTGALSGGVVTLRGGGGVRLGHDVTARDALALSSARGDVAQRGGRIVAVGATTVEAGGSIGLQGANDFRQALALSAGGEVRVRDVDDLRVSSLSAGADRDVHLEAGGRLTLPQQAIDTGDGALTLISGATLATAGALSGGAVELRGGDGVAIGHDVSAGGALTLSSARGDVAQTAGRILAGATTTVAAGGGIRLAGEDNDFAGAVHLRGGDASIRDASALTLGEVDVAALTATAGDALDLGAGRVGGTLTATSERGGIGQSGALTVGGDVALDAAGDVTLLAGNTFAGTVDVRGRTVSLHSDMLRLDDVQADSLLARGARIELGRDIATRGAQTYEGALALTADRALSSAASDLRFAGTVDGAHALAATAGGSVVFADTIDVAALTVEANAFSAASTLAAQDLRIEVVEGGIGQSAAWRVAGTTTLDAGTGGIVLDRADNDFGTVHLRGGEAAIRDANALTLGGIDVAALTATAGDALDLGTGRVGGTLTATSERGRIGQSGALAVGGDVALDAAGDVTLLADNNFAGTVDVRGRAVSLRSDTLRLDDVQADSLLARGARIELGRDIATRGAQTYEGALALTADRALSSAASDLRFAGTVDGAHALTATAAGTVAFDGTVGGATALAALSVDGGRVALASGLGISGDLTIRAAQGGIVQAGGTAADAGVGDGAWHVGGTTRLDAGGEAIVVAHAGNDFAGAVHLRGGEATIRDASALTLGGIDVAALTATAGDALDLGAGRVGGALTATSERGGIGQSGALMVGGDVALDAAGDVTLLADNTFAGTVDVRGRVVSLRSDTLRLDDVQADSLLARGARIELGRDIATRGAQTYEGALALTADRALSSAESDLRFADTVDGAHALTATAAGTVTFADTIDVAALAVDANAFSAASTLDAQDLRITVAEGGIGQSAAWRVGIAALDAGTGDIALDRADNDFGTMRLRGGAVAVRDANDLAVAALASGADRDVSLVAGGTLSLPAQAIDTGTGALALASQGGALATAGALAGGDVTLVGRDGLALGHEVNARGALALAARDAAISQTGGRILAAGRTTVDAGEGEATLAQAGNDFAGPVDLTAGAASIRDANALALGAVDVGGALTVAAAGDLGLGAGRIGGALSATSGGGAIGQSGALTVGGVAALDAGGGAIALDQAGNDFAGTVHLSGGAVSIRDANALALGTLSVEGLRAASGGALSLGQGRIGGDLDASAAGAIGQSGALAVAGASRIDAGGGDILLDQAGNDFGGAVSLAGGAVSVRDANDLTVAGLASGADRDVGLVAGGTLSLPVQAIDTGAGRLRLASLGGRLDTAAALRGAEVSLAGAGGLGLGHDVEAAGTLSLSSGGDIVQTGGALAAATLTGGSAGATRLDAANRIDTLGAFSAQGLSLSTAGPLRIAGPVEGGARAALTVAGDLALDGRLAATDVRLQAGGGIAGGAGGAIVAHTLSGRAGGAVVLGDAGRYMDNQVDLLGDFVAHAGFSLTNGRSLTLASLGGSAFTVDAGTAATYLWVDGDLLQSGEAFLHNGVGTWAATGHIGLQDAPIRVVGVDPQWVEAIGLPPAYFYAVRADGSLLPVIGASAVNVPASIWAGRAQSASRRDVGYVDVGADASNYRPYGVVGPGIRLPEDQQPECDPDFPTPECMQVQ
ncbi:filamentous hemagglutinin N-terminal domain-containing protein [Luteimonas sp. Y-2-2-4F]|nr:filamentous hemagglutinin N-terminal domain-containing protein [Luteimonas sp. Y-2-2-4F]MCD9032418.1 filamentous hemagglutinin N-terminal domain-containing protein [Luteimonas sp. Y-2-2-4F]